MHKAHQTHDNASCNAYPHDPLIRRLEACTEAFGLIHRELGHYNILIDDEAGISFIDFTTLGWGWFVHDIGTVVRDLPRSMWDGFFHGYASVRSLTQTELLWIDTRVGVTDQSPEEQDRIL